jgi:predicted nucleic acid-binding Zn ribbon protein
MTSTQHTQRFCVSCGRSIDWDANLCPYCGHDYRSGAQFGRPPKKKHTTTLIVAIVVVVIVVVVVLPALLYVMVVGFGGYDDYGGSTPGINVLRKSSLGTGFKIEFTAPTSEVKWSDVTIQLYTGADTVSWNSVTSEALTSATQPAVWHGAQKTSGSLVGVYLNITDLAANGIMSNGDYITIQMPGGFASSTTYTLTLLYEPTSGSMLAYPFTG